MQPIAFVDVETTGLDPAVDRVAEIAVILVDGEHVDEWSTFIGQRSGRRNGGRLRVGNDQRDGVVLPLFTDIAMGVRNRLAGRLLVAHNARFDYAFLKAEFQRAGIDFSAEVLCTMMLSRRLYPQHACHDLDALMQRHALTAEVRHRALPDARLLWQFWQAIHRDKSGENIAEALGTLLAGPVLPDHLDPALIGRLPEAPGIYIFHDSDDVVLQVGEARNLKLHLIEYFRLDRASAKALALACRVRRVTWRTTQGMMGARLKRVCLQRSLPLSRRKDRQRSFSWQLFPDRYPAFQLVPVERIALAGDAECFGTFTSGLKARNALTRLARKHYLCHALLGIAETSQSPCLACSERGRGGSCSEKTQRLRHLVKASSALRPFRMAAWPHRGPIGIRERADVHIFDEWRYLGTARSESDVHEVLLSRPHDFDVEIFSMVSEMLSTLPERQLLRFAVEGSLHERVARYEPADM